jgi:transposase
MKNEIFSREELNNMDKDQLVEKILDSQNKLVESQAKIDILTGELNHAKAMLFGRRSEKADPENEQISFEFNEAELYASEIEAEETKEITVGGHTRKVKVKGKKELDLSKLPKRTEPPCTISEEKLKEIFPEGWKELPDEIHRHVEYEPAKYICVEKAVKVYASKKNDRIVRADHPADLLPNSIASASLVSGVMNGKYVNAAPLYRIEQEFERNEIPISRQTMSSWIMKCAERYLSLLYDRLIIYLRMGIVIHADETPVLVTKDGRKAGTKSYMWVYRSSAFDENAVVIYEYQKTRKKEHPKEFLKDFSGTIVTDGYQSYHGLAKESDGRIRVAGCWIHALRKYKDAIKSMDKAGQNTAAGTLAAKAIEMIQDMMHKDNQMNDLSPAERYDQRNEKIAPLVDEYFEWVKQHRPEVTRKSKTGTAFTYSLDQEQYLREFLTDGNIPMENNAAERAIRPFTIGRKNWVMCDTIHGAEDSAIIYSITETAKANELKPYEYLKHLLTEIPKHMEDTELEFLEELLPWSDKLPAECRRKHTE